MKIDELLAVCEATKAEPARYSVAVQYRYIEAAQKHFYPALRCLKEIRRLARSGEENADALLVYCDEAIERFEAGEF